jgi:integrase
MALRVESEGPVRITKATIEAAWRRRAPGLRLVIRDVECRGLALVVNPTAMSWTYSYKPRGLNPETGRRWPSQAITIGTPETHEPHQARDAAGRHKGTVKGGGDPAAMRRAAAVASAELKGRTVARLLDAYAKALPGRPSLRGGGAISPHHAKSELVHARAAVATMEAGDLPVANVQAGHIRALLTAEAARPATARHRLGAISRFFDWLQEEGLVPVNPCALVGRAKRRVVVRPRTDFLDAAGLARLWQAAGMLADVHRDLVRILIAVPCRRGEAARLDWSHLDLAGATWTIPGTHAKNRDPHRLHLHPLALATLRARWAAIGKPVRGLVFPAPESGGVVDTFSNVKERLDRAVQAHAQAEADATGEPPARLPAWRWHDFRRSFATALGEAGVAEAVADAVLNHRQSASRGGVLGVYQQARRWPEQKAAMTRWGDLLAAAINGRPAPTAQVVALHAAAG